MEETSHIVDRKRMRSQTLDLLRFPLAVVVLLIHTFGVEGLGVNGRAFEPEQYPLFVVVRDAIEAFLGGQSVPVYFFISGYVFFLGVEWTRGDVCPQAEEQAAYAAHPLRPVEHHCAHAVGRQASALFPLLPVAARGRGRTDVGQRPVLLLGVQRRPERDGDGHHRAHRLPAEGSCATSWWLSSARPFSIVCSALPGGMPCGCWGCFGLAWATSTLGTFTCLSRLFSSSLGEPT